MARSFVITELGLQGLRKTPLSKVEGSVLWYLVERLPASGDTVSKAHLETCLAIGHMPANKAMKLLCELGFILRGPKIGISYHYKINPAFIRVLS